MESCDEYETVIEARLRAALDLSREEALARHVASCPRCTGYLGLAQRTNEALFAATRNAVPLGGWDQIRARLSGTVTALRRGFLLTFVISLLLLPLIYWIFGTTHALLSFGMVILMLPYGLWMATRRAQALAWAERIPGDLLQYFRDELGAQRRMRCRKIVTWSVGLMSAVALTFLVFTLRTEGMLTGKSIFYLGLLVVIVGDYLFMRLVLWPRGDRELEALG
jgi:hypothetical protein